MMLFHSLLPRVAERETRSITLLADGVLPKDTYSFLESFCEERDCDCRHAFILVMSRRARRPVATLGYGWEDRQFYVDWFGHDDVSVDFMHGLCLAPLTIQTELSERLLDLFAQILKGDDDYRERIVRHYRMFRQKVDERASPERVAAGRGRAKGRKRKGSPGRMARV